MPISQEEENKYLESPFHCPYCGSQNIETSIFEGDSQSQEVECRDCGKIWDDCYKLVGILERED